MTDNSSTPRREIDPDEIPQRPQQAPRYAYPTQPPAEQAPQQYREYPITQAPAYDPHEIPQRPQQAPPTAPEPEAAPAAAQQAPPTAPEPEAAPAAAQQAPPTAPKKSRVWSISWRLLLGFILTPGNAWLGSRDWRVFGSDLLVNIRPTTDAWHFGAFTVFGTAFLALIISVYMTSTLKTAGASRIKIYKAWMIRFDNFWQLNGWLFVLSAMAYAYAYIIPAR